MMWTKNGERTLDKVLSRIEKVIPEECIDQKFVIDDYSIDATREIAAKHGWLVFYNSLGGIANAANQALNHIATDFFCSFEQDIILDQKWWKQMCAVKCAVSHGVRFSNNKIIRVLEELQNASAGASSSIDNTIFLTDTLRRIGGFPTECPVCADANLRGKLQEIGEQWCINPVVVSVHLRSGFWDYLRGQKKWWTRCTHKGKYCHKTTYGGEIKRFLFSPIRGIQIAYKKRMWQLAFAYPIVRATTLYFTLRYGAK